MSAEELESIDKWYCCKKCEKQSCPKKTSKLAIDFVDHKIEYAKCLLWHGLNEMCRYDALKENDGQRIICHWKFDLLSFFEENHNKYFIYAVRLLSNVSGGVSTRLAHQLTYNRTVNIRGGSGRNVEKDLHCEHLNQRYKGINYEQIIIYTHCYGTEPYV